MSYSSISRLNVGTKIHHVDEFVRQLGFEFVGSWKPGTSLPHDDHKIDRFRSFHWYEETDYRSWTGVELTVYDDDGSMCVETRTPVARSYFDLEHQNRTIKLLRRHFGGSFETDEGAGRYLVASGGPPSPSASGCHIAFQRFGSNLISCSIYFVNREFKTQKPVRNAPDWLSSMNPWVISNNLLLPFLVATLEDYWKSTYVALLKYSSKKDAILRSNNRLVPDLLASVANGRVSVEQAVSETLSFQRVSSACRHIDALDTKLGLAGILRKPYRRRKTSLYDSLDRITEIRHDVIHRAKLDKL